MNNEKLELAKKWQRQGYTKDNAETELIDFAEMDPSAAKATVNKVFEAVLKEHKDAYGDETKDLDKKATKRIQQMIGEGRSVMDITDTIGDDGFDRDEIQDVTEEFYAQIQKSNKDYCKKQNIKEMNLAQYNDLSNDVKQDYDENIIGPELRDEKLAGIFDTYEKTKFQSSDEDEEEEDF